jgi:predicted nucleotide-binding protein
MVSLKMGNLDIFDAPWADDTRKVLSRSQSMPKMDKDAVVAALAQVGLTVVEENRNGNNNGWCLHLDSGAIVNLYDTGKIVVQGKNTEAPREALGLGSAAVKAGTGSASLEPRKVFVIYGHDTNARTELEAMLRRWGLEPLILDQLPSGGQTIIEKLERVRKEANFAVVLATPDDEGHRKDHPDEKALRARQNVVLELGMMLAILGRPKVAILLKTDAKMERPSDIQGLLYISFTKNVNEAKLTLAQEINNQGIRIDLSKV